MKIQKRIYYFTIISLSILIVTLIWPLIRLPVNENEIIGQYSQNKYNSLNDIIRYLLFILIPIFSHCLYKSYYEKNFLKKLLFNLKTGNKKYFFEKKLLYIFVVVFFLLILEFFSNPLSIEKVDLFHAGQKLSSAFKSSIDNSLWSGSYVTVGIIYETLGSKFIWNFFNQKTIGGMLFLDSIYLFITKVLLLSLVLISTTSLNLNTNLKIFFFIISSLMLLYVNDYSPSSSNLISFRDGPIILSLILFLKGTNSKNSIYFFIIGFLSLFIFLWSVDRAIVFFCFLLLIIFYLILNKKIKNLSVLLFSILFFWFVFFIFFNNEFYFFLENTFDVIKHHSYINGIIHPSPFSSENNSSRATKTLILIIISLIISINLFLEKNDKYSKSFKICLFSLSILSFLSYLYALGRSDGPHIKQSFLFPYIFFSFYFIFNFIFYVSKIKIDLVRKNLNVFFIYSFCLLFVPVLNLSYLNILSFNQRLQKFISLDDNNFISKNDKKFIELVSEYTISEKCIELFTNDAIFLYLLKKPNCSKFYFVYSIGTIDNQKKKIKDLNNAKFIISNGKTDNWSTPISKKYTLISEFIDENYLVLVEFDGRKLNVKKN